MSESIIPGLFDPIEVVGNDTLQVISGLCEKQLKLEKEIEEIENLLKEKKESLEKVSRLDIPELLNKTGLSELKLANGLKVIVDDKIQASIANKNYSFAYLSMIKAEGGNDFAKNVVDSLFKNKVVIDVNDTKSEDELLKVLLENDIPYDFTRSIHHQTLKKYCREKLETGSPIPDGITVFQYQETTIKK